ncbi:integrase domain-containing protein [Photobacterium sp. DNB23_23_1]|uniref:Integrase domain-containing protein n=1 Tax=Photobacterium pectinilyticum TaxID=2906793 RepID=A0ABT1N2E7_9GAMM|nr:integrase domain-containing protein [Photobacterium sp. ZSDE20]MCQ1058898.1 integrase domain-containing protein [Photobacterium sp. ZSDE20]MDD1823812.1 integrase domain-containing protein [Photobacterium sp. ZSDE20]
MKFTRCRWERQHPNARNFGLGSRDIVSAAQKALQEKQGNKVTGISTTHNQISRFKQFAHWIKAKHGIGDLRKITQSHLMEYADHLRHRVEDPSDRLKSYTSAANYLSAVNTVLAQARGDQNVRFTASQAGYPERDDILRENKTITDKHHENARSMVEPILAAQMGLMRHFGARFEGSCKLNVKEALSSALKNGYIRIDCEKNQTPRTVTIRHPEQISALEEALPFQGSHHSLIPPNKTYAEYSGHCYQQFTKIDGYLAHSERRFFAQTLYSETIQNLTGIPEVHCPVVAQTPHGQAHHKYLAEKLNVSLKEAKSIDKKARKVVSKELGHKRISITNSYIG